MERNKCYTVQDLQDILRVSRVSISKLLKKKEFRWIRLDGGQYRISRKALMNGWMVELRKIWQKEEMTV